VTRRRLWGAAASVAALALAVPTGSSAAGTYVYHGGFETLGTTHGTSGYEIELAETGRRVLRVTVAGRHTTTTYKVPVRSPSIGRIVGNLGRRGNFDLHFVPVGKPKPVPIVPWCTGPKGVFRRGFLVGRYRFRGERDYTRVSGHLLPAATNRWSPLRCRYATSEPSGSRPRAHLSVSSRSGPRTVFGATVFHRHERSAGQRVQFRATLSQREGRVSISREVDVDAGEGTVAFPGGPKLPEVVTVTPPAPFTGSATFSRTPESTFAWSGDLAVDFPGLGPLRLSGPRFLARMCALEGCVAQVSRPG
jgi:hypothetical protein